MILGPHRQPLVRRVEAGTFGHGPAQQNAVQFQPEIVMQARGVVFLDEVRKLLLSRLDLAGRRFAGLSEIALASVFFERHVIRRCSRR